MSLLPEDASTQLPIPNSDDLSVDKGEGKQIITQNTSPTNTSQSPNTTPTTSTTQPHKPQSHPQPTPCSHNMKTSTVTRWIPKRLLQVQGYFKGETDVRLPCQPHHQKPTSPSQSKPQ